MLQTNDGGYIAIGFTDKNRDFYVVKTDFRGNTIWTRTYGTADKVDFGYTVAEAKDGGFIMIGHSEDLNGEESKIMLIKTTRSGHVEQP